MHRYRCLHIALCLGLLLAAGWRLSECAPGPARADVTKSRIVIGTELDYPPFSFLDPEGRPVGYNVDLARAVFRHMGVEAQIKIKPWGEIRHALETGEIDAIVGMYYSIERDHVVDFSIPFSVVTHNIFIRKNDAPITSEKELKSKSIIVMEKDIMHDYVLQEKITPNPVVVKTQADALRLLATGKHDCALLALYSGPLLDQQAPTRESGPQRPHAASFHVLFCGERGQHETFGRHRPGAGQRQ